MKTTLLASLALALVSCSHEQIIRTLDYLHLAHRVVETVEESEVIHLSPESTHK